MPLLGPAPGANRQLAADGDEEQEESSGGVMKLFFLGAVGFAIYKVVTGLSDQELEGT